MDHVSCWVVTDGRAGMENQCLGLAEALGTEPVVKRIVLRSPWRELGPYLRLGKRFAFDQTGDGLHPPWPDLLIGTGRHSVIPSILVRKRSHGRTFTVQIQDPVISPSHFDLVVVPAHDRVRGRNVLVTRGALHHVSPARLQAAARQFAGRFDHLPHPRVAVLIGGNNGVYTLSPTVMGDLAEQLVTLASRHGAGLMVTPSRRTGADNTAILQARLRDTSAVIWDGQGDNPYIAFLALADLVVVTCDSVSMTSEACSTGKPVYVVELEGGSAKFRAFHEALRKAGVTRRFDGSLEAWHYVPLNDTVEIAELVRHRLAERRRRAAPGD